MNIEQKRIRSLITYLLSFIVGISILLYNFKSNISFFYTPSELLKQKITSEQMIRIGGLVETNSVTRDHDKQLTIFTLTDLSSSVTVRYVGILPNLFREGQGIVASGKLMQDNVLIADELLAKHDENYMPKEVIDKLKESGYWQENQSNQTK